MRITIPPISTIFSSIEDWRKARGKRYRLIGLLNFIILGMLCGKTSGRAISRWGKYLPQNCQKRLGLGGEHQPSAAMICRVFWHIKAEVIEEQIRLWVTQVHEELVAAGVSRGIAIDGKSIRRAASLGSPNAYLVSAVCHQLRFVLAQQAVENKTNEITQVPILLERLLLKGLVITVDALLTQRTIVRQLRAAGAHYLMYVKENQPRLFWALESRFAQLDPLTTPKTYHKAIDKGHGRVETRQIWTIADDHSFPHWPGIAQLFCIKRRRLQVKRGKFTENYVYILHKKLLQSTTNQQKMGHLLTAK
jgi:predicted transposase YbfD/YdcC